MTSGRQFALYFSWDKQEEAGRPLATLNDRFPALFELRRAAWPMLRNLADGEQGIAGFLDRIVLGDFAMFLKIVSDETGLKPIVASHVELDGTAHPLGETVSDEVHTLIVVSLDHVRTGQAPTAEDIAKVRAFLARPETVLAVCPHHYIGGDDSSDDGSDDGSSGEVVRRRIEEHRHHGDPLVPGAQRLGGYARSLLAGLDLPVHNLYGLRPACSPDGQPAPLEVSASLDTAGFLGGNGSLAVTTFNAHPHLPHLQPVGPAAAAYTVLARQLLDVNAEPHPFTDAGHRLFNAFLWAPPAGARRGHVVVCDATVWSAAFKGVESLTKFWRNLAAMPV
jgi:hypothetical protein